MERKGATLSIDPIFAPAICGPVYDSACAGESVGNDRLTLLAQLEGDDERWSAQFHASPRLARLGSRSVPNMDFGFTSKEQPWKV
jgi:hypothetical protein